MKKILVPTDLSPVSHNATKYALALAEKFNAEITLLSVSPLGLLIDDSMLAPIMITQAEIMEKNKERLKDESDFFSETSSQKVKAFALEGDPANVIINMAIENNYDLIIMGTKGKGNSNSFFGSTTTSVINRSVIPLLVIPENSTFEPLENIALASDFETKTDLSSYKTLITLAEMFESKISIVNVLNNNNDLSNAQVIEKMNLNQLFSKFRHTFHTIANENVEEGITNFIQENPAQILAMIARKHNFFARLLGIEHTKRMSYNTKIPLLVVHPN